MPQFTDLIMNNPQGTPTHMMCAYAAHISWPFEGVFGRDDVGASLEYAATWDVNNDYSYSYPGGVTPTKEENEVPRKSPWSCASISLRPTPMR